MKKELNGLDRRNRHEDHGEHAGVEPMQAPKDLLKVGELTVRCVPVNDTYLWYIDKGAGEPVVFVHGAITDLRIWQEQVETFSTHFRAISYSRRGHWPGGQAHAKEERPYSRSLHQRDLVGFLNALDLKKVHLVGHSFGGAIALMTALEHPELVSSLILGEPSPFLGLFDQTELDLLSSQKIGFDEAHLLAKRGHTDSAIRQFLNVIVGADVLDQLPPAARSIVMDNALSLAPMLEHYFESPPISHEELRKITIPALLISGEFSPKIALLNNELLHQRLPNSQEVALPSTSHGLHIENPAGFNRVVERFLGHH